MRWPSVRSLVPTSLFLSAACLAGNTQGPSSDERTSPKRVLSGTDTLAVEADAYLGPDGDDYWKGTTDSLVIDGARSTRVLIRVNQDEIEEAIGNGTLASATLELTVQSAGASWPTGGATVDAHRVLQHWTEAEVTWVCADGHEAWDMSTGSGSIWHATHTARTTITNGQTGVVRLNVTADVAAFLNAPQSNHGWLIKRTLEGVGEPGRIAFASRETTPQPRLILEVTSQAGSWPVLAGRLPAFASGPVASVTAPDGSTETYLRTGASLRFEVGTTDAQKEAVVSQFGLTVLGATDASRQRIFVTFADRGSVYADLAAFLDSLQNSPSVAGVLPILVSPVAEIADARFPTDGNGQGRSDWIGGSTSTWAYRAIRAPLAWGCETGTYSSPAPAVAVLEWNFDDAHPEYSGLIARNWVLTDSIPHLPVASIDTVNARVDHSTAVVGTVSAIGDNSSGTAGVVWRSSLYFYSMRSSKRQALPLNVNFYVVADEIMRDRPRVLSLSADQALTGATQAIRDTAIANVTLEFQRLLDSIPELLIVVATGNERINKTLTAYRTQTSPAVGLLRIALLTLRANPAYAGRIVVVTGTQSGNQFASIFATPTQGANFFTDLTDIAAPAVDVATLRRRTGSSIPTSLQSGTSLAAPMVAGVAAQLLTMHPTLTPAEIKSYILRGAQEPKQDPSTGAIPAAADSTARRVQGAPGPAYQLDAYGSLTLLSRERQGTPLCGLETVYRLNPVQGSYSVTANRQAPELIISNAPAPSVTDGFSVAQGGRLLAIANQPYRLQNGNWTPISPIANVDQVAYLERDTVYLRFAASGSGIGTRFDLYARLNQGGEQLVTGGLPGGLWAPGFSTSVSGISPTGDFLHFRWTYGDGDLCNLSSIGGGGEYLARLRTGGRQVLNEWFRPECATPSPITGTAEEGVVAWRRDGAEMMRAVTELGSNEFRLRRYQVSTSASLFSTGPAFVGYRPSDIHWSPEGGRLTLHEQENALPACQLAIREVAAPHNLIEPAMPLNQDACFWVPRLVPLRGRLMATLADRAVSPSRRGHARLTAPAQAGVPAEFRLRSN